MITVVTAFVPIPDHPRSAEEFHKLAEPLLMMSDRISLLLAEGDLNKCWLYEYLYAHYDDPSEFSHSIADNPQKNSLAYHVVQAQKTEWLVTAAMVDPTADVFVWIDYGIFHVPGVTGRIIEEFLQRAENERTIAFPGCWEKGTFKYDDAWPCWRWCGGTIIVPREYVDRLNTAMKHEYIRWLNETGNISWEVNTLARVEHLEPDLPFWFYKADHNASMFTNFQRGEDADGKQAQTNLRGVTRGFNRGSERC
jgi:hypothetical protein